MKFPQFIFTLFLLHICHVAIAQKPMLSASFQDKMEEVGIEFLFPVEKKIKVKEQIKDDFMTYDLILRSKNYFELRYIIDPISNDNHNVPPNVRLTTMVSTLATNDQEKYISIQEIDLAVAKENFNAEWGVYADFIPKEKLTNFSNGRIISLYQSEKGTINCIILHDEESLDGFLGMPIQFSEAESLDSANE